MWEVTVLVEELLEGWRGVRIDRPHTPPKGCLTVHSTPDPSNSDSVDGQGYLLTVNQKARYGGRVGIRSTVILRGLVPSAMDSGQDR